MATIPSLPALKQRLNALLQQKAQYGISADPHITTEAQDLETVVQQMGLIEIHRASLAHLLQQRGQLGTHTPSHVATQIDSTRQQIARLRAVCSQYGHPVPAHPLDSDEPSAPESPREPVPVAADPLAVVREKLRDVETMLRHGMVDQALALVKELQTIL